MAAAQDRTQELVAPHSALHRSADSHPLCFTGSALAVPGVLKLLNTREDGPAPKMATTRDGQS